MNTDPLRSINWYPNPTDRDCFSSSLANLLLFQGDAETAEQVQANYQHSPFRVYNGFIAPVASRAVHDLTGGRYEGKAYLKSLEFPELPPHLGDKRLEEHFRSVFQEELDAGRVGLAQEEPNYNSYRFPAIVLTTKRSGNGHALVATGERCDCCHYPVLIDDGRVRHSLVSPTPSIGIVEVFRT